ncbi:MAG: CoA-binding protein [Prosthecobacter sp.]|nr:CoA-binding protein [Prosthecobacter sp.]
MPLESFFHPRSIALIGATERVGSVGRAIWKNLRGFEGAVFPVNAKRAEIFGVKAFPNITALPEASKFGDELICDDCYAAYGSCCAGEEE